jgi:hypothetical protein
MTALRLVLVVTAIALGGCAPAAVAIVDSALSGATG